MTLYDLIKRISAIITPNTDDFYEYVIHTSDDDGGFLRTRFCWWDKAVKNRTLYADYKKVLVTCEEEIDIVKLKELEKGESTPVKMQLTYSLANPTLEDADWDVELGYCHVYLFDLENNTYTHKHVTDPHITF